MDLHPTQDQLEIIETADAFLSRELPAERLPLQKGTTLSDGQLRQLADMGWFGLALPERFNGLGLSVVEEAMIVREFGRALLPPSILAAMIAGHAAAELDDEKLAVAIANGACRVGFAVPLGEDRAGAHRLVDSDRAEYFVGWNGASAFLAAREAFQGIEPGSSVDQTIQIERARGLSLTAVRTLESGRSQLPLRATLLTAAMLAGGAHGMMTRAVEYARVREQFGRPIGAFQAISHRLADMAVRCEAANGLLQFASVRLRDGAPDPEMFVATARVIALDAARQNAAESMQIYGGYGQTYEFLPHFFLKRALILSVLGGGEKEDESAVLAPVTSLN